MEMIQIYRGTDHTREQVPLIIYSKQFNEMKVLNDGDSLELSVLQFAITSMLNIMV